jgi:hypothetical protein
MMSLANFLFSDEEGFDKSGVISSSGERMRSGKGGF